MADMMFTHWADSEEWAKAVAQSNTRVFGIQRY